MSNSLGWRAGSPVFYDGKGRNQAGGAPMSLTERGDVVDLINFLTPLPNQLP